MLDAWLVLAACDLRFLHCWCHCAVQWLLLQSTLARGLFHCEGQYEANFAGSSGGWPAAGISEGQGQGLDVIDDVAHDAESLQALY